MVKLSLLSLTTNLWLALFTTIVKSHETGEIKFSKLPSVLPIGLSDMAATYAADFKGNGVEAIILTGGCSAENGNESDGGSNYYCNEITAKTFVFFPSSKEVVPVADMPIRRYRHSATFINGKLYVVGGRTFDEANSNYDALVKDIIVYDPKDGTDGSWSTFMTLEDSIAASDHTSFTRQGELYILGGYTADYITRNDFQKINLETKSVTVLKPMWTARGDAQAAYYNHDGIEEAHIMGGFTHENNFCEPLAEAEKYDFNTNVWTKTNPLQSKRGDKAVVVLHDKIVAIGGEDKHEAICANEAASVDPSSHATVVDDVESYEPGYGANAEWHQEADFTETRFRSAAAASEKLDEIYVFGGQLSHDPTCNCYKTSRDIFYYRDEEATSGTLRIKVVSAFGVVAISIVAWLL